MQKSVNDKTDKSRSEDKRGESGRTKRDDRDRGSRSPVPKEEGAAYTPGRSKLRRSQDRSEGDTSGDYTQLQVIGTSIKLAKVNMEDSRSADVGTRIDILEQAFNRNAHETQAYVIQLSVQ